MAVWGRNVAPPHKPGPSFTVMLGIAPSKFAGKQGDGNGDDGDDEAGGKVSKADAEYGPMQGCRWCEMFEPKTETCTKVSGRVSPAGWCRYYEPAGEERDGDSGDESDKGDERYACGGKTKRRRLRHDQGW